MPGEQSGFFLVDLNEVHVLDNGLHLCACHLRIFPEACAVIRIVRKDTTGVFCRFQGGNGGAARGFIGEGE